MMSVMNKGRETELDKVSGICRQVDNLDFIMRGYWTTGCVKSEIVPRF